LAKLFGKSKVLPSSHGDSPPLAKLFGKDLPGHRGFVMIRDLYE
jgi:hypothetical protein